MTKTITTEGLLEEVYEQIPNDGDERLKVVAHLNRWIERGSNVAVYQNQDLGHPELGDRVFISWGDEQSMIEGDELPDRLPDTPILIGWRYGLIGTYNGSEVLR